MRLHISRVQEFCSGMPTEHFEIVGVIPAGFGVPAIGDYELFPIGAAARAAGEPQDSASPAPAAAPSSSQGPARPGVGTRATPSPQSQSANPKPRPGSLTRILGKESSELLCCHPTKVAEATKGGPHIVVQFYSAHPTGSGRTEAAEHFIACWEEKLFPAIKATVHQEAEFYVERRNKAGREYVNIVGLRQKAEGARA